MRRKLLLSSVSMMVLMVGATALPRVVHAQEASGETAATGDDTPVMTLSTTPSGETDGETADGKKKTAEMVVISERDKAGLLEQQPSDLLFGIDKPLLETARSATFVSDDTLDAYGVTTVNDLASVSPGTFTASFYGVEGAVNVRGLLAETYFHGFKRIENRGTYQTPLGSTSRVDILRGPPTANFGPGKVGGSMNLEPKTAKISEEAGYLTELTGEVSGTFGSYDKKNGSFQAGIPMSFGNTDGGLYVYGEIEDSGSFYNGIDPEHQLLQLTGDFDMNNGWSFKMGGMFYHSDGYVQTPGWNRLTQDLIDNGTYTTGQNTGLTDSNGNGYLDAGELPAGGLGYYPPYYFGVAEVYRQLDTGVGTTHLSPHDVYISDRDFSETYTVTLFGDLVHKYDDGSQLKFQLFFDSLGNERFVSYGFPADYEAYTGEARVSYSGSFAPDLAFVPFTLDYNVGVSNRYYSAIKKESYNYGGIALDRRDLSVGATPTDTLGSPFDAGSGYGWDNNVESTWNDAGIYAMLDSNLGNAIDITLTGRYDWYAAESVDRGTLCYCTPGHQYNDDGKFTYSAMAMVPLPYGFRPYVTYAKTSAIEFGQVGDVAPSNLANGSWLSDGDLTEVGIKLEAFDGILTGSVAAYRQHRTIFDTVSGSVDKTEGKGVELEMRYLATDNLSFTFAGNAQQTKILGSYNAFYYFRPEDFGLDPIDYYGGALAVYDFSDMAGFTGNSYYAGEIEDRRIPEIVASLFATYTTDQYSWGQLGATAGVKYVSETAGLSANPVHYPDYYLVQASAFADFYDWKVQLNVNNLFDEEYFTPLQDLYGDIAALPGKGREWRVTATYRF